MSKGEKYYTNQDNEVYWNVWRISNKQGENMKWGHGASFPIELPFEGINKFSAKSAIIYEPFTGSGTTMVAAHQLKRKCYGMELDPKYCQVIIDRMIKLDSTIIIKRNGLNYER
jgi:DNA modification methylase